MGERATRTWSAEEEKILHHEALVSEAIRIREEARAEKRDNDGFIRLLSTSGVTAFITVVLGGLIGQLIISSAQTSNAREDRRIAEHTEYLKRRQETVNSAYTLVGKVVNATEAQLSLTKDENSLESVVARDRGIRQNAIVGLQNKVATTLDEWDIEQERLGLLMRYYHYGQPAVIQSWRDIQECVNQYVSCAGTVGLKKYRNEAIPDADYQQCEAKKGTVRKSLDIFAGILDQTQQYAWREDAETGYRNSPRVIALPPESPLCMQRAGGPTP